MTIVELHIRRINAIKYEENCSYWLSITINEYLHSTLAMKNHKQLVICTPSSTQKKNRLSLITDWLTLRVFWSRIQYEFKRRIRITFNKRKNRVNFRILGKRVNFAYLKKYG